MTFQPGETVRVKSGGPELTFLSEDDDKATCLFFSDELGEFKETSLPLIALEAVDEDEEDSNEDDDAEGDDEDEDQPAGGSAKKQRVAA